MSSFEKRKSKMTPYGQKHAIWDKVVEEKKRQKKMDSLSEYKKKTQKEIEAGKNKDKGKKK